MISEAIKNFVKCIKEDTNRFTFRTYAGQLFYITDQKSQMEYTFGRATRWGEDKESWMAVRVPFKISQQEIDYIYNTAYSEYLMQKEKEFSHMNEDAKLLFSQLYKLDGGNLK